MSVSITSRSQVATPHFHTILDRKMVSLSKSDGSDQKEELRKQLEQQNTYHRIGLYQKTMQQAYRQTLHSNDNVQEQEALQRTAREVVSVYSREPWEQLNPSMLDIKIGNNEISIKKTESAIMPIVSISPEKFDTDSRAEQLQITLSQLSDEFYRLKEMLEDTSLEKQDKTQLTDSLQNVKHYMGIISLMLNQ